MELYLHSLSTFMTWAEKLPFLRKFDIKRMLYVGCRVTDIYHWEMYD